jgi:16S rRNA (adenine1518-N6/adenine1519-N6)-dimethyltransferase
MHQIQLIRKYGIQPRKIIGQNFLVDENIQRKIVALLDLKPADQVLEIGAGLGALTGLLAGSGAKVFAVEKDKNLAGILKAELERFPNLQVLNEDALKLDFGKLENGTRRGRRYKVVGNLPYFITTPILFFLIAERRWIEFALIMVQKEFAERLFAQPGTKSYGRLTLALRYHAEAAHAFDVSRHCFTPVPGVDSSLVRLKFRRRGVAGLDEELFFRAIQAAFASRRKNILNALSHGLLEPAGPAEWDGPASPSGHPPLGRAGLGREEWKTLLAGLGIPETKRAEELLLKDYIRLTFALQKRSQAR